MINPTKKPRVYTDTSVFGGIFDDEFKLHSIKFFESINSEKFKLIISPIVQAEIEYAPERVKDFFNEIVKFSEIIDISEPALLLRDSYLKAKIVTKKYSDDALHVAIATISECDFIVSWNFKHIVHYDKIPLYNAINILNGYKSISIYSPLEMI